MTGTTDILQFAGGGSANVLTQAQYAALTTILADGFSTGTALAPQLNKVWRQSSFIASGLANFIANRGINVPDDGNLTALIAEIESAMNAYLVKSVAGAANVTLNAVTEANYPIIELTGAITANINIVVPTAKRSWIFKNNTTGAFSITIKMASGNGVSITQGRSNLIYSDGTNVSFVDKLDDINIINIIDSIAALRLFFFFFSSDVYVTGYYLSLDGGGGHYKLDSADVTSTDNGGTIIVANDGGRWKLIRQEVISVKQFGAKGDGVADDKSFIQNAINSFISGSGVIYCPAGVYKTSGTLTIS